MPFLPPNQQCQSTEGKQTGCDNLTQKSLRSGGNLQCVHDINILIACFRYYHTHYPASEWRYPINNFVAEFRIFKFPIRLTFLSFSAIIWEVELTDTAKHFYLGPKPLCPHRSNISLTDKNYLYSEHTNIHNSHYIKICWNKSNAHCSDG